MKQKNVIFLAGLLLCPYFEMHAQREFVFTQQHVPTVALIFFAAHGALYGSYLVLRHLKEAIFYKKKVTLTGHTEFELRTMPLNEASRQTLVAQSSAELLGLYLQSAPQNVTREEESECRQKILGHFNMYQFPIFRRMVQKWPEYESFLMMLQAGIYADSKAYRFLAHIQGFKKEELCEYLRDEWFNLKLNNMGPANH